MRTLTNFGEFIASLEGMNPGFAAAVSAASTQQQIDIDSVYGTVKTFLSTNNLIPSANMSALENFSEPVKNFNGQISLSEIGADNLIDLCRGCGVPDNHLVAAAESVALCINNYGHGYGAATHFDRQPPSGSHADFEMRKFDNMYSARAMDQHSSTMAAALESFGTGMDNVITDAKVAITVAILRYHRSALHRLIPNLPTESNVVLYQVDHMEVYDLTKSRSNSAAERYDDKHRIPFVDLYRNPEPANTTLKPIVLKMANDGAGAAAVLLAENVFKIGKEINMFNLGADAGVVGYEHIDYTDLVGDSVRLKKLFFSVTDGTVTDLIPVTVLDHSGARMIMTANNADSADRVCAMNDLAGLDSTTLTAGGVGSTLLAGFSADAVVRLKFNAVGQINLRNSNAAVHGSVVSSITTRSENPVIGADQTLFGTLTITLVGAELDAKYSEENIRKTTKSLRMLTRQAGYEIPGSANFIVQYSLTQTRPEAVLDGLTKLMSVGIDDRGIKLIMECMNNVYNRLHQEAGLGADNYTSKIGMDFVAGQRVKPYIFMDTLTIAPDLANMRSGEKWGDLRGLAEAFLLDVLTRINASSYYEIELGAGEKPVYNCLTSSYIKNSLLSVPHYHNHLGDNAKDATNDGVVEFRRTLPNGTILNVITTTFDYMQDKMLIVPVRPNKPQSTLNFAQNRERGTFLTQASPTVDGAIFNQLIGNSREFPIITNPVGALLTVSNLSAVFEDISSLGI